MAGGAITGPRETRRSRMRRRRDLSFSPARASRKPCAARVAERVQEAPRHRRRGGAAARERVQHRRHRLRGGHPRQRLVDLRAHRRAGPRSRREIRRRSSASVVASSRRPEATRLRKRPSIRAEQRRRVPSCPAKRTKSSTDVCAIRSASASSVTVSSRSPSSGISSGGDEHRHLDGGGLEERLMLLRVVAVDVVVAEQHRQLGQQGRIGRLHLAQARGAARPRTGRA